MNRLKYLATELDNRLADADADLERLYPGDSGVRQPVHTVYIPADSYRAGITAEWGERAATTLGTEAGTAGLLAETFDITPELAEQLHSRVREKLDTEPIEDVRIDFEDGYGHRSDDEEDAAATAAAGELAKAIHNGQAPPVHGIRFKSLEASTRHRGLRTLDLFIGGLAAANALGDGFVVTLPKVTSVAQVEAMTHICSRLENFHGLPPGRLRFGIQVETPQSIVDSSGRVVIAPMIHAAAGRCSGLHYGTYDYSASCDIAAEYQSMEHPVADQAKALMQVAAAGTGVFLSDGSSNRLPVGDSAEIRAAWRLCARLVRRSLERGFYQGWDMHPAQLISRYVATYAFFRESFDNAAERLRAYISGDDSRYLDEPATAKALAGFVLRGLECGAVDETEVDTRIGVTRRRLTSLAGRQSAVE